MYVVLSSVVEKGFISVVAVCSVAPSSVSMRKDRIYRFGLSTMGWDHRWDLALVEGRGVRGGDSCGSTVGRSRSRMRT